MRVLGSPCLPEGLPGGYHACLRHPRGGPAICPATCCLKQSARFIHEKHMLRYEHGNAISHRCLSLRTFKRLWEKVTYGTSARSLRIDTGGAGEGEEGCSRAPVGCEHHAAGTGTPHGQGSAGAKNKPTSKFLLANTKTEPLVLEIYN